MKRKVGVMAIMVIFLTVMVAVTSVQAQQKSTGGSSKSISSSLGLVVFPAKSQSPSQQNQDEQSCYGWSKEKTGIDPAAPPPPPPQATGPDGSRARGAARGAAKGAVIGEVTNDDGGKGAAVGAAAGAVKGKQQSRKAQATQQQQASAEQMNSFKKGFSACMEGKGYTVK
jgi:hypothetical protein